MIRRIRNTAAFRILWGFLGFYLLNLSVDPVNHNPNQPENLSINAQESLIELVAEQILGFDDAIEEGDERDIENHSKKPISKVELYLLKIEDSNLIQSFNSKKKSPFPAFTTFFHDLFLNGDTPPPKV